jgi:hypothetical protein
VPTTWDDRTILEDVLARGVDDWVYEAEVFTIARRSGLTEPDQLRALSLGLITEVIVRGLMTPGEYDGETHRPWDCSTGDAVVRITEDWLASRDDVPTPGSVVWLSNTELGERMGKAVLDRERG